MRFEGRKREGDFPAPQPSRKRKARPHGNARTTKFDFVAPDPGAGHVAPPSMENSAPPSRPPDCVALVARTHWAVGGSILVSIGLLRWVTAKFPIEFAPRTYVITGGLAVLYGLAGTLVWLGTPVGKFLSRVCGLLYLARPQLGSRLWTMMDSEEFQAHFGAPRPPGS